MSTTEPSHRDLTDAEKGTIIEEVRVRTAIWDSSHADHSKRNVINALLEQVAAFMTTNERKITGKLAIFGTY